MPSAEPLTLGQEVEILRARVRLIESFVAQIQHGMALAPELAERPPLAIEVWREEVATGMRG